MHSIQTRTSSFPAALPVLCFTFHGSPVMCKCIVSVKDCWARKRIVQEESHFNTETDSSEVSAKALCCVVSGGAFQTPQWKPSLKTYY